MQRGKLIQLVDHRRRGCCSRCLLLSRGRCLLLLLLEVADALVLLCFALLLLLRSPPHALARDVRAAAHHSRAHQRASPSKHHCLLAG